MRGRRLCGRCICYRRGSFCSLRDDLIGGVSGIGGGVLAGVGYVRGHDSWCLGARRLCPPGVRWHRSLLSGSRAHGKLCELGGRRSVSDLHDRREPTRRT